MTASTPFSKTVTFSEQQLYRRIIRQHLKHTSQRLMLKMLNIWFRNRHKGGPIAPGLDRLAKDLDVCGKTITRLIRSFEKRGFLRYVRGGDGAGRKLHFAVDLTAIREALAPRMVVSCEEEKGDIFAAPIYNIKRDTVGKAFWWMAGLVGRSHNFKDRMARCLTLDARATWRRYVTAKPRYLDSTLACEAGI